MVPVGAMPRYSACFDESVVSFAPTLARCSAATFSSRCLGSVYTVRSIFSRGCGEQFDLSQHLVAETRAHHEAGVTGRVAQVDQAALGQNDQPLAVRKHDLVDLRLDVLPLVVAQGVDLDLRVEVADVADDGSMFHRAHVIERDHVDVAGRGDEDVALSARRRPW